MIADLEATLQSLRAAKRGRPRLDAPMLQEML